jgi:hypothetical protein
MAMMTSKVSLPGIEQEKQKSKHEKVKEQVQEQAACTDSDETREQYSFGRFQLQKALSLSPRRAAGASSRRLNNSNSNNSSSSSNNNNNKPRSPGHEQRRRWDDHDAGMEDKTVHGGFSSPRMRTRSSQNLSPKIDSSPPRSPSTCQYEANEWLSVSGSTHTPTGSTLMARLTSDSYSSDKRCSPDSTLDMLTHTHDMSTSNQGTSRMLSAAAIARASSYRSSLTSSFDFCNLLTPHASLSCTFDDGLSWAMGGLVTPRPAVTMASQHMGNNMTISNNNNNHHHHHGSTNHNSSGMFVSDHEKRAKASPSSNNNADLSSPRPRIRSWQEHSSRSLSLSQSHLTSSHTHIPLLPMQRSDTGATSEINVRDTHVHHKHTPRETDTNIHTDTDIHMHSSRGSLSVGANNAGAGAVASNGAGVVASNGAGVVASNGAGVVASNGAGVVASNGAGVVANGKANNSASNNSATKNTAANNSDINNNRTNNTHTTDSEPDRDSKPEKQASHTCAGTHAHAKNSEPETSLLSDSRVRTQDNNKSPGLAGKTPEPARERSWSVPARPGDSAPAHNNHNSISNLSPDAQNNASIHGVRTGQSVAPPQSSRGMISPNMRSVTNINSSSVHGVALGSASLSRTDYSSRQKLLRSRCVCVCAIFVLICMYICACVCV